MSQTGEPSPTNSAGAPLRKRQAVRQTVKTKIWAWFVGHETRVFFGCELWSCQAKTDWGLSDQKWKQRYLATSHSSGGRSFLGLLSVSIPPLNSVNLWCRGCAKREHGSCQYPKRSPICFIWNWSLASKLSFFVSRSERRRSEKLNVGKAQKINDIIITIGRRRVGRPKSWKISKTRSQNALL